MCEIFGVSSPEKIQVNELLREFFSHGTEHPHGWGMAFFRGNGVSLEKQPETSCKSDYLKQRLRARIEADQMIAHIRLATKGSIEYENTHPFVEHDRGGRSWTLAHNGTVFECDALNRYVQVQQGKTDSERILLYIIDQIDAAEEEKGSRLSQEERFSVIDRILGEISPENKINLLLYDGELLYAHTNYADSLHYCRKGNGTVISTQPLDLSDWKNLPLNTPVAFRNGEMKFIGTDHGYTFVDSEEKMRLLFLDFASL